jgi:hypothetical protein
LPYNEQIFRPGGIKLTGFRLHEQERVKGETNMQYIAMVICLLFLAAIWSVKLPTDSVALSEERRCTD